MSMFILNIKIRIIRRIEIKTIREDIHLIISRIALIFIGGDSIDSTTYKKCKLKHLKNG